MRLEADNRDFALRPNMGVDLEFPISRPEATNVPADAVIESGRRKTVFVRRGNELFEARVVETGWRSGGRVQVVRGLTAGEPIVVAGTFLLESERRIRRTDAAVHD
jgi:Cu(I)/Ag(I) efflux system membrane fusion protein